MRILFAEDDRDLSRAVKALLEHSGYSVDVVFNGRDALEYAQGGGFSGFGGRGMKGQQRSQNQNSGSTGGMSFAPGAQSAPNAAGTEGI